MTFADRPVGAFLDDVASGSATPGGGSVAAVAGAAGAALCEMVCQLTVGKEGYESVGDELATAASSLAATRERLLDLADEDSAAFDEVMAAYRTPEDEGRAEAIQSASKRATDVPLETAEACLDVLEAAVWVTDHGNENAVTDGGTGAHLAEAALQAALYNVAVNLGTIDDEAFVAEVSERADELEAAAAAALGDVVANVEATL